MLTVPGRGYTSRKKHSPIYFCFRAWSFARSGFPVVSPVLLGGLSVPGAPAHVPRKTASDTLDFFGSVTFPFRFFRFLFVFVFFWADLVPERPKQKPYAITLKITFYVEVVQRGVAFPVLFFIFKTPGFGMCFATVFPPAQKPGGGGSWELFFAFFFVFGVSVFSLSKHRVLAVFSRTPAPPAQKPSYTTPPVVLQGFSFFLSFFLFSSFCFLALSTTPCFSRVCMVTPAPRLQRKTVPG